MRVYDRDVSVSRCVCVSDTVPVRGTALPTTRRRCRSVLTSHPAAVSDTDWSYDTERNPRMAAASNIDSRGNTSEPAAKRYDVVTLPRRDGFNPALQWVRVSGRISTCMCMCVSIRLRVCEYATTITALLSSRYSSLQIRFFNYMLNRLIVHVWDSANMNS